MSKKYVALRDFPMSRDGFTIIQVLAGESVDVPEALVDGLKNEGFIEPSSDDGLTDAAKIAAEKAEADRIAAEKDAAAKKQAEDEAEAERLAAAQAQEPVAAEQKPGSKKK